MQFLRLWSANKRAMNRVASRRSWTRLRCDFDLSKIGYLDSLGEHPLWIGDEPRW